MKVLSGKKETPYRALLTGAEGIGKSSFGASAEAPIVIDTEGSTDELEVDRAAKDDGTAIETYAEVLDAIEWLRTNEHPFRTLVIDTVDWLHAWIEAHVCNKENWASIESPGYGKGHMAVAEEWRRFLATLERLQRHTGMHVLLVGHAHVRKYSPPDGEAYDVFDLKMPDKSGSIIREWAKAVLFARVEVVVEKKDGKRTRGIETGRRILTTEATAAIRAKNRFDLPRVIPFDRQAFATFDRYRKQDVEVELEKVLAQVEDAKREATRAWFHQQPNRAEALDVLRTKTAPQAQQEVA